MHTRLLVLLTLMNGCTVPLGELPPELHAAWAEVGSEARLPILVRHDAPEGVLRENALTPRRTFRHVPLALADLTEADARRLVGRGAQLYLDSALGAAGRPVELAADPDLVRLATGADRVHAGDGLAARTGAGVTVALVDSGVWLDHPDIADGAVVAYADFVDADGDGVGDDDAAALIDAYGHGTMVAGVLLGSRDGILGVAPDVELVVARVLDANGAGTVSSAVAAVDWIISDAASTGVDILNFSVGSAPQGSFVDDPLAIAAESALEAGLVVVAAAGNFGVSDSSEVFGGIVSPAIHPGVIAVGAIDSLGTAMRSDDAVVEFSSRGPTAWDGFGKPDLTAPGTLLAVTAKPGSALWSGNPSAHLRHWPDVDLTASHYVVASGTSFAAPAVAGAVALMLEEAPGLGAIGARAGLQLTAGLVDDPTGLASGAGQINALGATRLAAYWAAREAGSSPAPIATEDVLNGEVVPWGLTILWHGWLTTDADVSWLNEGGILGVGDLEGTGILWDGVPVRYSGLQLSGMSLLDASFAFNDDIWGTGILWDGVPVDRTSSRVWSQPSLWQLAFVWPDQMTKVGATSPLFGPSELDGLTSPVDGASDPRPVSPDFDL